MWEYFSCVASHDFLPELPKSPNTCETGITLLLDSLDTRVRHYSINVEMKTLDYFSSVPAHVLEVFRTWDFGGILDVLISRLTNVNIISN